MSDTRSRRDKLRDMARQTVSPHEADIARRKLGEPGYMASHKPRAYVRPVHLRIVYDGRDIMGKVVWDWEDEA